MGICVGQRWRKWRERCLILMKWLSAAFGVKGTNHGELSTKIFIKLTVWQFNL